MTPIRIGVITPSKEDRTWLEVPSDIPANQLAIAIQHALGLPADHHYRLELRSQRFLKKFDHTLSLERNEISNGQEFQLVLVSKPVVKFRQTQPSDRIRIGLAIFSPWVEDIRFETIRVDPRLPLWEIINTADQSLSLPSMDANGQALAYHFEFPLGQRLPMTTSLSEQGIIDDDVLDLVGEPVQITQFRNIWRETFNQDPPTLPLQNLKTRESLRQIGTIIEILTASGITGDASHYYVRRDDMYNILTSYLETGIKEGEWNKISQLLRTVTKARDEESFQVFNARPEKLLKKALIDALSPSEILPAENETLSPSTSVSLDEGKFLIRARVPEFVQLKKIFHIEVTISFKLELFHWLVIDNKTPMEFDIVLFAPMIKILGPQMRQVSLPIMPGEHQIRTTFPATAEAARSGEDPRKIIVNLQFFQRGRYIGDLEVDTIVEAESGGLSVQN